MALTDDDVREILRIIDESALDELRIETDGLSLHVVRGGVAPSDEPERERPAATPEPTSQAVVAPESPRRRAHDRGADDRRLLPRSRLRARRRSSRSERAWSRTRSWGSSR